MGMLFVRCPHCSGEMDSDGTECPHCHEPQESTGPGIARKVAWVLGTLCILSAAGFLVAKFLSQPRGKEVQGPDGEKYIQAPQRDVVRPKDLDRLVRVERLAAASPDRIKVVLSEEMGPAARIWTERIAGQPHWVGVVFFPTLRNSNIRVEVLPYKNRVLFIKLHFERPFPNRAELLTLLGLQDPLTPPTADAMEGPRWNCFAGIDEVSGTYHPKGGPGIREATVTPNKALANYFFRGGQ